MSFTRGPITTLSGVSATADIRRHNRNVFMVIGRRKNGNVVVMEANVDRRGNITGIRQFWLDLDPKTKAKARKKGRVHDMDPFTKMDEYAYGIRVISEMPTRWTFCFKRFPSKIFTIRLTGTSAVVCETDTEQREKLLVRHMYVRDKPALGLLWPTVDSIVLTGVVATKKPDGQIIKTARSMELNSKGFITS